MFPITVHHRIIPVNHMGILNADSDLVSHEYDLKFCIYNRISDNMRATGQWPN